MILALFLGPIIITIFAIILIIKAFDDGYKLGSKEGKLIYKDEVKKVSGEAYEKGFKAKTKEYDVLNSKYKIALDNLHEAKVTLNNTETALSVHQVKLKNSEAYAEKLNKEIDAASKRSLDFAAKNASTAQIIADKDRQITELSHALAKEQKAYEDLRETSFEIKNQVIRSVVDKLMEHEDIKVMLQTPKIETESFPYKWDSLKLPPCSGTYTWNTDEDITNQFTEG